MENGEWGKGTVFSSAKNRGPPLIFLTLPKKSSKFPHLVRKSGQAYMGICPNHCLYFIFFFGSLLRVLQD